MKYIYYPEYELEYTNLIKKDSTDHILNIKILMFLCDQVLIPPSHLLNTQNNNIFKMIKYLREFFCAGKIGTTHYYDNLNEYFVSRTERIQDPIKKIEKEQQANRIITDLFPNHLSEYNKSDEKIQLCLFDTRLKELLSESNLHQKSSVALLGQMDALSNKTGEAIYSNQFREILKNMLNNKDISKKELNYFMDFMSNAYYYSGTYTMKTAVSYNSYFEKIKLHNSLINTHEGATNLIINPHFLANLFGVIGINLEDIYRLNLLNYEEIMSHKYWKDFMSIFDNLYTSAEQLNSLLREKEALKTIYRNRKDTIFSLFDVMNKIFSMVLWKDVSPFVEIGVAVIINMLKSFLPPLRNLEASVKNSASEKITNLIARNNDPLYEFSYRLNAAVNALR